MFQAQTENLCLYVGGERNYSTCVSDIKHRLVNYNHILTYVMATGSDEIISRIFSQPNAVMYAIEYTSCQFGVISIFTSTVYVNMTRKNT